MKLVLRDNWMHFNEGPIWKISGLEAARGL